MTLQTSWTWMKAWTPMLHHVRNSPASQYLPTLSHTLSSLLPQFTHHSSVSHPRISQWLFEPIHPSSHPLHPSVPTFLYTVTYPTSHIVYYSTLVPFACCIYPPTFYGPLCVCTFNPFVTSSWVCPLSCSFVYSALLLLQWSDSCWICTSFLVMYIVSQST